MQHINHLINNYFNKWIKVYVLINFVENVMIELKNVQKLLHFNVDIVFIKNVILNYMVAIKKVSIVSN